MKIIIQFLHFCCYFVVPEEVKEDLKKFVTGSEFDFTQFITLYAEGFKLFSIYYLVKLANTKTSRCYLTV